MQLPKDQVVKGCVCRYTNDEHIKFYVQFGQTPTMGANGKFTVVHLAHFIEGYGWQRNPNECSISSESLECLTLEDVSKLMKNCLPLPYASTDPILLLTQHQKSFRTNFQTMRNVANQIAVGSATYDLAQEEYLLQAIKVDVDSLKPEDSALMLLYMEMLLKIGTKAALEYAVSLEVCTYGAYIDQLLLQAKKKLETM